MTDSSGPMVMVFFFVLMRYIKMQTRITYPHSKTEKDSRSTLFFTEKCSGEKYEAGDPNLNLSASPPPPPHETCNVSKQV